MPAVLVDEAMNVAGANVALREFLDEPELEVHTYRELAGRYLTEENAERVTAAVLRAVDDADPNSMVEVEFAVRRDFVFRIEVRRLAIPGTPFYVVSHLDLTRERRRIEELEQLRVERERTQRIARVGSWRFDVRTGENTWSPEMYVLMGQDPDTFVPTLENRRRLYAASSAPAIAEIDQAIKNGHPFRVRYEIIRPGGGQRLVENIGEPQRDARGQLVAYLGVVRDVTEEVAHEQALERERRRLERAQEISLTGDLEVDLQSGEAAASAEFRRLFGLPATGPVDPHALLDSIHPDDRARLRVFWDDPRRALATEADINYRIVDGAGEVRHLRGRARLRTNSAGREIIDAVAQDVTDQVRADEDLRVSERRLSEAEAIANLGHWEWLIPTGALTWSRQVFAIAGIDYQPVTYGLFLGLIHPDDRERVTDAVQAALDDDVPYELVHRMVRPDGSIRTVLERGELSRTPDGAPYRMLGIVQDITETVAASEQLRLSEARLRAAEEIAGIGSWEWDTRLGKIDWSDEMYRIYGLPREESPVDPGRYYELVHPDDREFVTEEVRALLRGEPLADRHHRIVRPDGTTRVIRRDVRIVERDAAGHAVHLLGTAQDVTESVQATEQLRVSEARLRAAEEIAGIGSWEWDVRTGSLEWSDEVYRIYGCTRGEYQPSAAAYPEFIHPDDRARVGEETRAALRGEHLSDHRHRIIRADGVERVVRRNARVVERDEHGSALRVVGTTQDITEAVRAEERLRDSESRLRLAVEVAGLGHWEWDVRADTLSWSDENYRIHGVEPGTPLPPGGQFGEHIHPEERAEAREAMRAALKGLGEYNVTHRLRCPDGVERTFRTIGRVVERDEHGRAVRVLGTTQDVSRDVERTAELERLAALLAHSSSIARLAPYEWHVEAGIRWWSDQLYDVVGYAPDEITPSVEFIRSMVHPEDMERAWETWARGVRERSGWDIEWRFIHRDGSVRVAHDIGSWVAAGDSGGFIRGAIQDITHLVELRERAQDAADEVISIIDASLLPIIVIDERGIVQRANGATERVFGWEVEELVGQNVGILAADISVQEHGGYIAHYNRTGEASTPEGLVVGRTREVRGRRRDGSEFPAQLTVAEAKLGTGRRQFVGIVMDLTEQKTTEEHLRQMQKSEALGTLVAGVAHDFNNLLTAIRGGIDMAQEFPDQPRWLEIATQASDRAAEVVRQLLRFSRRDEPHEVELDPAEMIQEVTTLSRETLDRRIWFTSHADKDLPPILGDPGQMQQVLLNLIVNARDAVLEKAEHEPGTFEPAIQITARALSLDGHPGVIFEVRDNGTGMTDEVRERALDPFFTTKRADRGTGLGLASVVGIVQRHEGDVRIRTQLGEGTEFGVWLPSRKQDEGAADSPTEGRPAETVGGAESPTLLVVDDEEPLGAIAVAYLRSAGFDAVAFTNGHDALAEAERRQVNLAILDVNMPSPNGWEVLAALRRRDPDLPVLVCSGFAEEEEARSRGATAVLPKPYSRTQLLDAVHAVLRVQDVPDQRGASARRE